MTKLTLTIGIPAYNEEANIGYLLEDLLNQNQGIYVLDKIIVSSDASTDNTDNIVRDLKNEKVILYTNELRQGQAARQNQIIESAESDILVLLNADISIDDPNFLNKLLTPILSGADLVCGPLGAVKPVAFFEKVVAIGAELRRNTFAKYKQGINLFTCHGSHRAFSKRLYNKFRFTSSIAEDAYSFFYCIVNGYKYDYAPEALVSVKLPSNLTDHLRQSSRFFISKEILLKSFHNDILEQYSKLPITTLFIESLKLFLKSPLLFIPYISVSTLVFFYTLMGFNEKKDTWQTATSSKKVRA